LDKTQHSYPSLSELQQGGGRLGDVLRFWNHISEIDLDRALQEQKNLYRPLGLQLIDLGIVEDEHVAEAFAERGETYASMFDPCQIDEVVLNLISVQDAARFGAVPLRRQNGSVDVALAEPLPPAMRIELERMLGQKGVKTVRFLYAPLSDIAFAVRFAWAPDPFAEVRSDLARMRANRAMDASQEALLWRSVRAGYVRLGDILVRRGDLTHTDLQLGLASARHAKIPLGQALVLSGFASQAQVDAALEAQSSADWVNQSLAASLAPTVEQTEPEPVS